MEKSIVVLLIVLLAVIVAASAMYVLLLQEKLVVEKDLAICQAKVTELGEAKNMAKSLQNRLQACTKELEDKKAKISSLEKELENATSTIVDLKNSLKSTTLRLKELEASYSNLSKSYRELLGEYSKLKENYAGLEEEYTKLGEKHAKLVEKYMNLTVFYKSLEKKYRELSRTYNTTLEAYRALRKNYTSVLKKYTSVLREKNELSSSYEALQREYESLKSSYDSLLSKYESIVADYNTLSEELNKFKESAEKAFYWNGGFKRSFQFLQEVLQAAVREAGSISGLKYSGPLYYRALRVFETILLSLSYCHDNYVRVVDPITSGLKTLEDTLMLPNETWATGCGDCDDLALLAYSALEATKLSGEKLFIIVFYSGDIGHVAVLGIRKEGAEKHYYVIDPAGNYYNGVRLFLRLTAEDSSGKKYYVYLSPLGLSGYTKTVALKDFYKLVYEDYFTGKKSEEPQVYYYDSALYALQDWLKDYWGLESVDKIIIYNDTVYGEFSSISKAAAWLSRQ